MLTQRTPETDNIMEQIIKWHKTYTSSLKYITSLHFSCALELKRLNRILTYEEYSKICKTYGICHLNLELYNSKLS